MSAVSVRGGALAKRFVAKFDGEPALAAKRAKQVLDLMRRPGGGWRQLVVQRPDGTPEDVYISADKSRAALRCELDTRTLGRVLSEMAPRAGFETVRRDHLVSWRWKVAGSVSYDRVGEKTVLNLDAAVLAGAGLEKAIVETRYAEATALVRRQRG